MFIKRWTSHTDTGAFFYLLQSRAHFKYIRYIDEIHTHTHIELRCSTLEKKVYRSFLSHVQSPHLVINGSEIYTVLSYHVYKVRISIINRWEIYTVRHAIKTNFCHSHTELPCSTRDKLGIHTTINTINLNVLPHLVNGTIRDKSRTHTHRVALLILRVAEGDRVEVVETPALVKRDSVYFLFGLGHYSCHACTAGATTTARSLLTFNCSFGAHGNDTRNL
jgi:hypothetical protein